MKLDRVITVRNSKTVYRDGDICIKVFDENNYDKAYVLNEALNQSIVEKTGILVPRIQQITEINGKWSIVSEYIKGKTLDRLIFENPEKSNEYMNLFADLHISVNSKKCCGLAKQKETMLSGINSAPVDAKKKESLFSLLDTCFSDGENYLCHGEFVLDNIIITADSSTYILDWPCACSGIPAADAAWTYLLLWQKKDAKTAALYLNAYSQSSGISKKYIQSLIPLAAAAHCSRANEKQREFLLSWIK